MLTEYRKLAGNGAKDFNGDGLLDKLTKVVTGDHFESELYDLSTDGMDGGKSQYISSTISEFRTLAQEMIMTDEKYADMDEFVRFRDHVQQEKAKGPNQFTFQ